MKGTSYEASVRHRVPGAARIAVVPLVGAVTLTLIAGTAAFAAFSAGGSGSNGAQIDERTLVATAIVAPEGTFLYAGGGKAGLTISIKASDHRFRITGIKRDPNPSREVVVSNAVGPCSAADAGITLDDIGGINYVLNPGDHDFKRTIAKVVSISSSAPNGCQGATFAIPVVLTGRSF